MGGADWRIDDIVDDDDDDDDEDGLRGGRQGGVVTATAASSSSSSPSPSASPPPLPPSRDRVIDSRQDDIVDVDEDDDEGDENNPQQQQQPSPPHAAALAADRRITPSPRPSPARSRHASRPALDALDRTADAAAASSPVRSDGVVSSVPSGSSNKENRSPRSSDLLSSRPLPTTPTRNSRISNGIRPTAASASKSSTALASPPGENTRTNPFTSSQTPLDASLGRRPRRPLASLPITTASFSPIENDGAAPPLSSPGIPTSPTPLPPTLRGSLGSFTTLFDLDPTQLSQQQLFPSSPSAFSAAAPQSSLQLAVGSDPFSLGADGSLIVVDHDDNDDRKERRSVGKSGEIPDFGSDYLLRSSSPPSAIGGSGSSSPRSPRVGAGRKRKERDGGEGALPSSDAYSAGTYRSGDVIIDADADNDDGDVDETTLATAVGSSTINVSTPPRQPRTKGGPPSPPPPAASRRREFEPLDASDDDDEDGAAAEVDEDDLFGFTRAMQRSKRLRARLGKLPDRSADSMSSAATATTATTPPSILREAEALSPGSSGGGGGGSAASLSSPGSPLAPGQLPPPRWDAPMAAVVVVAPVRGKGAARGAGRRGRGRPGRGRGAGRKRVGDGGGGGGGGGVVAGDVEATTSTTPSPARPRRRAASVALAAVASPMLLSSEEEDESGGSHNDFGEEESRARRRVRRQVRGTGSRRRGRGGGRRGAREAGTGEVPADGNEDGSNGGDDGGRRGRGRGKGRGGRRVIAESPAASASTAVDEERKKFFERLDRMKLPVQYVE
ncbi:hypothetical protein DFJ73DRAFT_784329 [Zopfochytrium polystomum]|nr:hypothetical protein DFJ73DRAFT_784329 [Zopfochytrium polystomum]